ncbi:MAG: FtsW/RodA/SpoVE family cell cycle protein [Kiritimatiellia bacterium]|jgi:cell division protein FtsW
MKWVTAFMAMLVFMLVLVGLVVQASTSDFRGVAIADNATHFIIQQTLYFIAGLVCCLVIASIHPAFWFRKEVVLMILAGIVIGLLIVHVPGLGKATKGAKRWITLVGFSLQPSEFVKPMGIMLLAWWHGDSRRRNRSFIEGSLIPFIGIGVICVGFKLQDDLGSIIMFTAVALPIMLAGGSRLRYIMAFGLVMLVLVGAYVMQNPERRSRVMSVLAMNTEKTYEVDDADLYHVTMSRKAIQHGGLMGTGFLRSNYKFGFLPENHTDFIFAMLCEEGGFVAATICVVLFLALLWCGIWISLRAPTKQMRLLAFGMALYLNLCAAVNMAVVIGILPTKGLALPFISYGGSSLVSSMIAVGILLGIGWRCPRAPRRVRVEETIDRRAWVS